MLLRGKNVRVRGLWWHYQFEWNGQDYSGNTDLEGCEQNRKAAEAHAARVKEALRHPAVAPSVEEAPKTFANAVASFEAWARDVEYRSKPNTSARLKTSMASCREFFGERLVREIGAGELESYKGWRIGTHGVRDITLRHDLHALSVFFQYAMRKKWCAGNPVEGVKIPSDRDAVREHVVSDEEEAAYFAAAEKLHAEFVTGRADGSVSRPGGGRKGSMPNMADLARLMLETGARPEEILSLQKVDYDREGRALQICGGKSRAAKRRLDLTSASVEVFERRLGLPGPWLFPSDRRAGRHVTKLQGTHDRICLAARVSFVPYDFRHTWATRMIAAGVDVPTVAALMGHSGLRTIYRYVHPTAEAKKRAMDRFEAAGNRKRLKVVGE